MMDRYQCKYPDPLCECCDCRIIRGEGHGRYCTLPNSVKDIQRAFEIGSGGRNGMISTGYVRGLLKKAQDGELERIYDAS